MGFKDLAGREGACYGLPFFSSSFHMLFGRAGTSRFSLLSSSFFPPLTSTCFLDYTPHIPFYQSTWRAFFLQLFLFIFLLILVVSVFKIRDEDRGTDGGRRA